MSSNYWKAQQKLNNAKRRLLKLYPNLPEETGIYILTRVDEQGFKYAYIGQTKAKGGILKRLADHLLGYQHIDNSLKAHKLKGEKGGEHGWEIKWFMCLESELDGYEQEYILKYANRGYQMRNKTQGGQGQGKNGLGEQKASKGYYDGLKQGYANCLKDIRDYFDKYLMFEIKKNEDVYKKPKTKKERELPLQYKEIYVKKYNDFKKLLLSEGDNND